METLESLNGRVVTDKHNRQYSLVMGDIAAIQGKIPIREEHRPFVSLRDVLNFMSSAQGVDLSLEQAARKHDPQVTGAVITTTLTEIERFAMIDKLIGAFMGLPRDAKPVEGQQEQEPPPAPLAEAAGTGS